MRKIFCFILLIGALNLNAQRTRTTNNNLWIAYIGDHKLWKSKFGAHLEYQERRSDFGLHNQQNLARVGFNYYLLQNVFITTGYCFVQTYPYGAFAVLTEFSEHRPYQQLQINNILAKVETVSRFRLEQRWSYLPFLNTDGTVERNKIATYTNRVRWMQRFSVPLSKEGIVDNVYYLTAFDEIFINFGKNVQKNIFDQNRAFFGLGYKIKNFGRLELGYLNHLLFRADGVRVEYNHTISLTALANFGFKRTSN